MSTLTQPVAQGVLANLGFRIRTTAEYDQAVQLFQATWLLGTALAVRGGVGPLTSAALAVSEARRRAGLGTASEHFSYREFTCRCGGRYTSCRRVLVDRALLIALERLRTRHYPNGMTILSGYRCPGHNQAIGGAPGSRHLTGQAADFHPIATVPQARAAGFTGVGYRTGDRRVQHGDTGPTRSWAYT